jgi:hypothetical protein
MNTPASPTPTNPSSFTRFADFYPFYLGEHSNRHCRRLHFVGSSLSLNPAVTPMPAGQLEA